jgi:translocation and assembly module TamB
MLKAYQKSDYEAILDGYFIETGVAFTLTMDYNRFKEIFRKVRTKEDRQKAREQRKADKERKDKEAEKIKQEEAEKANATKIKTDNEK